METLHEIGIKHGTDKATYHRYCDFYEKHLHGRGFDGRLLEIGVMDGASLRMWREWYPKAEIVGIDINPKHLTIDGVSILQMDATDIKAMHGLGMFDIIIDDGSHMTLDQQITFRWMYASQLNKGGFYVMEDLHTSFISNYVNSSKTTYDILKGRKGVLEYNGNNGQSITMIIPK